MNTGIAPFFFFFFLGFIYLLWLCWVFVAARRLSPGAALWLWCMSFLQWLPLLWSSGLGARGRQQLQRADSVLVARWLSMVCSMWELPSPGLELASPVLAGGFFFFFFFLPLSHLGSPEVAALYLSDAVPSSLQILTCFSSVEFGVR